MKKYMRYVFLSAVLSLTLASCSVYHPQAVGIPLIDHSGDSRIEASASASFWAAPDALNLNLTATHGFNDYLAGQIHFNYGVDNYYGQVAPGYYLPFSDHGVFEAYFGYGYGGVNRDSERDDSGDEEDFNGRYHLPFAQINIGCHDLTGAHIDLGFGMKVGYFMPDFNYTKIRSNVVTDSEHFTTNHLLFEPQVMVRFGSEKVRLGINLGFAWLQDFNRDNTQMIFDFLTGSIGLSFSL